MFTGLVNPTARPHPAASTSAAIAKTMSRSIDPWPDHSLAPPQRPTVFGHERSPALVRADRYSPDVADLGAEMIAAFLLQ